MPARIILDPKLLLDTKKVPFDFLSSLAVGETLLTAATTASVYSGTDITPSALISGVAVIGGSTVTQMITGGTVGCIYELDCRATTSLGQVLHITAYLAVIPDLP